MLQAYRDYIDRTRGTHHEYVDMVSLASWAGRRETAIDLVEASVDEVAHWPAEVLNRIGGLDSFRQKLFALTESRERLLEICEGQIGLLKVGSLPTAALLP